MRLANGPASTHVKSTTRRPSSGLPAATGPTWRRSAGVGSTAGTRSQSASSASRSSTEAGGGCCGPEGVPWKRANGPGMRTSSAPSTARNEPRNSYCGLSTTWATVCTSPNAMWRRWASRNSSPESLVEAEAADRVHHARDLGERLLDRHLGQLGALGVALLGHPLEQQRRLRDGADVARAVLGVGHHVGAEPVQRSLAQRPLRDRQQVGEPPLEEEVLDRGRHDLVQREVDERAVAGLRGTGTPRRGR